MLFRSPLALNIQTFINLVGYGYTNVWELVDVVDFDDPKVEWVTASIPPLPRRGGGSAQR